MKTNYFKAVLLAAAGVAAIGVGTAHAHGGSAGPHGNPAAFGARQFGSSNSIIIVGGRSQVSGASSFGSKVSLNPQPLPPKIIGPVNPGFGSKVSLNPQPLPPKIVGPVNPGFGSKV